MVGGAVIPAVRGGRKIKEGGEGEGGEIVGIVSVCVEVRGKKQKKRGKNRKGLFVSDLFSPGGKAWRRIWGEKGRNRGQGAPKFFWQQSSLTSRRGCEGKRELGIGEGGRQGGGKEGKTAQPPSPSSPDTNTIKEVPEIAVSGRSLQRTRCSRCLCRMGTHLAVKGFVPRLKGHRLNGGRGGREKGKREKKRMGGGGKEMGGKEREWEGGELRGGGAQSSAERRRKKRGKKNPNLLNQPL